MRTRGWAVLGIVTAASLALASSGGGDDDRRLRALGDVVFPESEKAEYEYGGPRSVGDVSFYTFTEFNAVAAEPVHVVAVDPIGLTAGVEIIRVAGYDFSLNAGGLGGLRQLNARQRASIVPLEKVVWKPGDDYPRHGILLEVRASRRGSHGIDGIRLWFSVDGRRGVADFPYRFQMDVR